MDSRLLVVHLSSARDNQNYFYTKAPLYVGLLFFIYAEQDTLLTAARRAYLVSVNFDMPKLKSVLQLQGDLWVNISLALFTS